MRLACAWHPAAPATLAPEPEPPSPAACLCAPAGLRRSRRTELAVGFDEGAADDAECAICHLYMHLSAGEPAGGSGSSRRMRMGTCGTRNRRLPVSIAAHDIDSRLRPHPSARSGVRLLRGAPRVPAPRAPPVRLRHEGPPPALPPLDARARGHCSRWGGGLQGEERGLQGHAWIVQGATMGHSMWPQAECKITPAFLQTWRPGCPLTWPLSWTPWRRPRLPAPLLPLRRRQKRRRLPSLSRGRRMGSRRSRKRRRRSRSSRRR